jgi:hypothetical protein
MVLAEPRAKPMNTERLHVKKRRQQSNSEEIPCYFEKRAVDIVRCVAGRRSRDGPDDEHHDGYACKHQSKHERSHECGALIMPLKHLMAASQ